MASGTPNLRLLVTAVGWGIKGTENTEGGERKDGVLPLSQEEKENSAPL